jgi:hypothetical protein
MLDEPKNIRLEHSSLFKPIVDDEEKVFERRHEIEGKIVFRHLGERGDDTSLIGTTKNLELERKNGRTDGRTGGRRTGEKRDHLKGDKFMTLATSDFEISNTYLTTYQLKLHLQKKFLLRHPNSSSAATGLCYKKFRIRNLLKN